jgi:tetratricopeptide (TPR) repeat protein
LSVRQVPPEKIMILRTLIGFFSFAALLACVEPQKQTAGGDRASMYTVAVAASAFRQADYPRAISLADAAIASDHVDAGGQRLAHGVRAAAAIHTEHYDQAVRDLDFIARSETSPPQDIAASDTAVAAHPNQPAVYFARAELDLIAAQYAQAIDDCDIAIALELAAVRVPSRDRAAWNNFDAGQYQTVVDDLSDNFARVEAQPYTILLRHLASAKVGRNDEQELQRSVDAVGSNEWPAPVLAFYLGRIDRNQLFAAAENAPNRGARADQHCEAYFYAGELAALEGKAAEARDLLGTAKEDCPVSFFEASAAVSELARLPR